jgi:carboxymethylenebutenolidase
MIEEEINVRAAGGSAEAVLFHADDRRPGVVHLTDIGGIRASQREMARRLAEAGYTVLMPNVFYRTGRPPMFDFRPTPGDERTAKRFAELAGPLTPEAMEGDAAAYVDFLAASEFVSDGAMGVVGYCFTGGMAMRTAAVRPQKIAAAASFHGGGLFTAAPSSPHLALPRIKARLYFGHATNDRSMPADAIEKLDTALREWGGKFVSEVYQGAGHGWTVPDNLSFNREQADRAFQKLTALLAETLK